MKNLAIILSHCDTLEKIDTLKQQIQGLKNLKIDTLLISHIPLDPSLQKEVSYYIYDQDNPLLYWPERALKFWNKTVGNGTLPVGLTCMVPDYGWTAIDQILKATNFALPLKYDYYSFINYDSLLTREFKSYLLDPSNPVTVTRRIGRAAVNVSIIFTVLEHIVLAQISANISKAAYLEYGTAEEYWENLLSPYSCFTLPSPATDTMNVDQEGTTDSRSPYNQNHFNNRFHVFFQNGNKPNQPRLTQAYFFHVQDGISLHVESTIGPSPGWRRNQTHIIKKASVVELPDSVTRLGVWDEDVYCDFLPEFNKATHQYHSITQFDCDDDVLRADLQ
jgi:hypothetical protein